MVICMFIEKSLKYGKHSREITLISILDNKYINKIVNVNTYKYKVSV